MLADMFRAGVRSVAMEASSHALAQERVRALAFDIGVFTNLSRDHLDYHRDMEDYFLAKSRLFTDYLSASPKPDKAAVIFGEDPRAPELFGMLRGKNIELWSYGGGSQWDVRPLRVERGREGVCAARFKREKTTIEFDSPLVGAANLQNILGAIGVASALKLDPRAIADGVDQLRSVPGRLEKVPNRLGITILVDYAHFAGRAGKSSWVRFGRSPRGKLITVFGCGGDRDRGKRPVMGEIAGRLSDDHGADFR
jgi:UDP-N-acetylmuramoyl-L-alanyl-D-glutamate--2,6-diaminopimelate ligase